MKIRYSEFHPDPSLRGKINDSLPRSRAQAAVDSGLAVEIPYTSYRERLASEEASRQASLPAPPPVKVSWEVTCGILNRRWCISAKCSRGCSLFYDEHPSAGAIESLTFCHSCSGCAPEKIPAAVAAQYRKQFAPPTTLGADEAAYHRGASGAGATKLDRECNEYVQRPGFVSDQPARDWSKL
jgi:hypothetical protein